jgi:secondary thiamine-phosphate synthase enzyme
MSLKWFQHEISITAPSRGCHLITSDLDKVISKDIGQIKIGMCNLFIQHTSASLTVNENADPDVRLDLEVVCYPSTVSLLLADSFVYKHSIFLINFFRPSTR